KADLAAAALLQIKVEEVDNTMSRRQQAIGEIADDAAEDEAESDLAHQRARVEVMSAEEQDEQSQQGDDGQQFVVAAKETPGGAGIVPVNEFEKARDDTSLVPHAGQKVEHDRLGQLIERQHRERDGRDAAIARGEQRLDEGHMGRSFK